MRHPFENNEPVDEGQRRPMPCPECTSTKGYARVGNFRAQCLECNKLIRVEEIGVEAFSRTPLDAPNRPYPKDKEL